MAVKLNARAVDQAKWLIKERQFVADDRDAWSEHKAIPPARLPCA